MTLNAQIIKEKGKPKFAVLSFNEYEILNQGLADFDSIEDFLDYIRAIKTKNETQNWYSLDEVKKELGIE